MLSRYLTSEKYKAWPITTRMARFGAGAKPSLVKENRLRRAGSLKDTKSSDKDDDSDE